MILDATAVRPDHRGSSKPTDGLSSGKPIGFVAHKAEGRWARGVVQQAGPSVNLCAHAKRQAGADRFDTGQICQERYDAVPRRIIPLSGLPRITSAFSRKSQRKGKTRKAIPPGHGFGYSICPTGRNHLPGRWHIRCPPRPGAIEGLQSSPTSTCPSSTRTG